MKNAILLVNRIVLSLIWLYNGLWLKVILQDQGHMQLIGGLEISGMTGSELLLIMGLLETLLGLFVLTGYLKIVSGWIQLLALLLVNFVGISQAGGVENPVILIMSNLPILSCMLVFLAFGPGRFRKL